MEHVEHAEPELFLLSADKEHHVDEEAKELKRRDSGYDFSNVPERLFEPVTIIKQLV